MRVYNPPQFNLLCRVWLDALPPDLSTWDGYPPSRAPDFTSACQLYLPRDGFGRWLHAVSDNAPSTFLHSGFQELRLPRGTPLRTAWGVTPRTDWTRSALVEVPAGSGQLYVCCMADDKHKGFPNEYRIGILAQLRNAGSAGPMAAGIAVVTAYDPPASRSSLACGFAGGAEITVPADQAIPNLPIYFPSWYWPYLWVSNIGVGTSAVITGVFAPGPSELGIGTAATAKVSDLENDAELGIGTAATTPEPPTVFAPDPAFGAAATATSVGLAGNQVGGLTCETAYECQLNKKVVFISSAVAQVRWFKFPITVAGVYKATAKRTQGNNVLVTWKHGACPTPGDWASGTVASVAICNSSNLNPGTFFVKFNGPASSSTYEITFGTGGCP